MTLVTTESIFPNQIEDTKVPQISYNHTELNFTAAPIIGTGHWFTAIHVGGIISLCFSIFSSCFLISQVTITTRRHHKSFWQLKLPERFVVYLAICDLTWSGSHLVDHSIMLATHDNVPDPFCAILGALLSQFVIAQAIVVSFTAINAMILVVKGGTVMHLGKCDWKLLSAAIFLPGIWGAVLLGLGIFGPSGAWCLIDARKEHFYASFNNCYSGAMIVVFIINISSYTLVTCKVRRAGIINSRMSTHGKRASVHKIAATSAMIILAYFVQWWPWFFFAFWSFFDTPHVILVVLNAIFCNLGGVFNYFAYKTFRRTLNRKPRVHKTAIPPRDGGRPKLNDGDKIRSCPISKEMLKSKTISSDTISQETSEDRVQV